MFGSIDIKVRPIKLAYLVDPNNITHAREAIRLSSTLWGGVYFPLIPLHKRMPSTWRERSIKAPLAKNVILGYIEAFDPDILVQFSKDVPAFITEIGLKIIKPEEIWQGLDEGKNLSPKFGLGIFELLKTIFKEYFKYKAKYPVKIVIPKIPRQFSLFWASLFGEIPAKIITPLKKDYFEPLEIQIIDFHPDLLGEVMASNVLFPRKITRHKLNNVKHSSFRRDASVYFLDATKVEDIIDFWNLRATGRNIVPVPKQLKENTQLKEIVAGFLKDHRRPWPHNPTVCDYASIIRARNCTMDEMKEYGKTLRLDKKPGDTSGDPFFSLQHWYPRIWDEWARDKDGAVPDDIYSDEEASFEIADTKELRIRFKPLLPEFAQKYIYHGAPRCANEIGFRLYGSSTEYLSEVFPKSSGKNLARAISGLTSVGDWRVGRNGLVKLVKNDFKESRDIPIAENIVFSWLTDLGWKPKLSAPGMLAKQIYRKLEGNLSVLKNEKLFGLLEYMNGGLTNRDGSPVKKNNIGQERDLAVGEVKSRLETPPKKDALYNYLIAKEIFKLGLRTQCPHCLRNSWFPLGSVSDLFTCPRCLNIFPAVGNVDNATWTYKTTGPFSVPNYADGAYSVLLSLEFFDDLKMLTIRTSPVLSFKAEAPNKKEIEADFAMFWQELLYSEKKDGIIFGECKTYGKFEEKDFDRMRYLAKTFPGAILVFSTLRKSLTNKEVAGITRIAKTGRRQWKAERPINPVLILTGAELLSWFGPPHCWDDSIQKKYGHAQGLIELSNTTQQIYLNLPSWHDEWRQRWEMKHQRRQAKKSKNSI